jgi:kynurenine formamidase
MRVIDLTHLIEETMPVFPGTERPVLEPANTLERDGFREKKLHMVSHTGTHMDAPAHMLDHGATLDSMPASKFVGKALKIDARSLKVIERQDIESLLTPEIEFIVLWTGWSQHWGTELYFGDFPALSRDAAVWLSSLALKGVGVDSISIDPMNSERFEVHLALLGKGMVLIENLRGLEDVPQNFLLSALPLKLLDADGSPVRAVALIPEEA